MSDSLWTCPKCGEQNSGIFCSKCGTPKDSREAKPKATSEEYQLLQLQIKREQMLQEQEAKKIAAKEELNKKISEYNEKATEYNIKSAAVPIKVMKKWACSWIVLIMAIAATLMTACSLVSLINKFIDKSYFTCVITLIKVILNVCLTAGFWMSFSMGRNEQETDYSAGPRMLRSVFNFYKGVICAILILSLILAIILTVGIKSCTDEVTSTGTAFIPDLSDTTKKFDSAITTMLITVIVVLVIAIIAVFICFAKISNFANSVVESFRTRNVMNTGTMFVAVIFFIIGIATFILGVSSAAATSLISKVFEEVGDINSKIGKYLPKVKTDIGGLLSNIANAVLFIFGGVLALQFGKLQYKVTAERNALEKPVKPV